MKNTIPKGPWKNPVLSDKMHHDAIVKEVIPGTYGAEHHPMIRIIFEIPSEDLYFVTNMYFPADNSAHAEQRLWHFCRCVGLEKHNVKDAPEAFIGRKLSLETESIMPAGNRSKDPYSAVLYFHPAETEEDQPDLLHVME